MFRDNMIVLGNTADGNEACIAARMANRHGLITGATGTGKTTTLKLLAESFSEAGVPVFFSDVKGDLAGMAKMYPVTFWDIYGRAGIPARTTISEMGPILLAKLMDLNDTQSDVLTVAFKIADDQGLLLIDTKDLKSLLQYIAENNSEFASDYGNIAQATVTTIIRNIVALEAKGAENFFAEPALNIADWFTCGPDGRGMINVLDAKELINDSTMYSTFLLWMLSELFETLPEVGDLDRPRMVFFFDEAHLLFKDINKALKEKIEQVIKLIRSKGVGVYFISQNPKDIPDTILAQLGNKIQHGLRAYTPADEKIVRAVAETFRANPAFSTYETILGLGTGEALVSTLGPDGIPCVVEKVKIAAPNTMDLSITEEEKQQMILTSNAYLRYKDMVDRDSAYEFLQRMKKETAPAVQPEEMIARQGMPQDAKTQVVDAQPAVYADYAAQPAAAAAAAAPAAKMTAEQKAMEKELARQRKELEKQQAAMEKELRKQEEVKKKAVKKVMNTAAGTIGRQAGKSMGSAVGGSFGKTLGGNVGAELARSILGTFVK